MTSSGYVHLDCQRYVAYHHPTSDVAENLGTFLVRSAQAGGMTLNSFHPVEGSFGNEFPLIYNHCGVMAELWRHEVATR